MIPVNLLFRPPTIIRNCPVRDWREVTLWFKWGLLLSILSVFIHVYFVSDPSRVSYIFTGLDWLNDYHDTVNIPRPLQFALYSVIQTLLIIFSWVIKSVLILIFYNVMNEVYFDETKIAFSLSGASMVVNIWYIVPFGAYIASIHGLILTTYLSSQINRLSPGKAFLVGLSGLVPIIV